MNFFPQSSSCSSSISPREREREMELKGKPHRRIAAAVQQYCSIKVLFLLFILEGWRKDVVVLVENFKQKVLHYRGVKSPRFKILHIDNKNWMLKEENRDLLMKKYFDNDPKKRGSSSIDNLKMMVCDMISSLHTRQSSTHQLCVLRWEGCLTTFWGYFHASERNKVMSTYSKILYYSL